MDLVILAAGSGTRYHGLKQFDPVGPQGQCLYYYCVYDAVRAGFNRMIFVIRESTDRELIRQSLADFHAEIEIEFVTQEIQLATENLANSHSQKRVKPWGTTHALLQASEKIQSTFAIVNSDDFYGADAFKVMATYLQSQTQYPKAASMVAYQLDRTLSEYGTVNRGICQVDDNGYLTSIREIKDIEKSDDGKIVSHFSEKPIPMADSNTVSMNFWGFHPDLLNLFEENFVSFTETVSDYQNEELCLSTTVEHLIRKHDLRVKVLPTNANWFGITHSEDRRHVCHKLSELGKKGQYATDESLA